MAANPMFGKVIFLAAARATDKVIVASVSYNGKSIDLGAVRPMLATLTSMKSLPSSCSVSSLGHLHTYISARSEG